MRIILQYPVVQYVSYDFHIYIIIISDHTIQPNQDLISLHLGSDLANNVFQNCFISDSGFVVCKKFYYSLLPANSTPVDTSSVAYKLIVSHKNSFHISVVNLEDIKIIIHKCNIIYINLALKYEPAWWLSG